MLRSPELPPAAGQWIDEYVAEKLASKYGHSRRRLRVFRAQVELQDGTPAEKYEAPRPIRQAG
jgi:hypothetical protein